MAAGDIVSAINILSFQPAATVEVIIFIIFTNDTNIAYRINNGIISQYEQTGTSSAGYNFAKSIGKFPINNTNYYTSDFLTSISGLQIT